MRKKIMRILRALAVIIVIAVIATGIASIVAWYLMQQYVLSMLDAFEWFSSACTELRDVLY